MTTDLFVPPAAEGIPLAALDSATEGADRLDAAALTPTGRNFLAHALVQLARDGWLRTEPAGGFEPTRDRATPEPDEQSVPAPVSPPTATGRGVDRDRIADAVVPLLLDTLPKVIARARGYEIADVVLSVLPACSDPIECSHEAALAEAQQETRRLGLMVDEYGQGASALTDKLQRARDMHRETCPWAQGGAPSPAFRCGMCEVLDAPAVLPPDGRAGVLSDADRQFLTFALDLAADQMASRGDEFEPGDEDAMERLRRLAAGERDEQQAQQGGDEPTESVLYEVVGDWGVDGADSAEGARAAVAKWLRAYPKCGAYAQQRIVREWPDGSEFYGPWTDLPPAAAPVAGQPPADVETPPGMMRPRLTSRPGDATVDPAMCPRCKGDNQEAFELCAACATGQSPADTGEEAACTCAAAGDCFAPSGHYADCPQATPPAIVAEPGKES